MTPGSAFTVAAYLVGALVFWARARQKRVATHGFALLGIWALCGGVLGAKAVEWTSVLGWGWWQRPLEFFSLQSGGRTILGGVLGGWLGVELGKRRLGIRRSTGDLFALAIPAGEAVGRIGCHFNGCCYGKVCALPFAIYQHGAWRHPAQIYAALASAVIFVLLWRARDRWPHEGDAWKAFLVLWGAARFIIEALRAHDAPASGGGISSAQWLCLALVILGAVLLWRARRFDRRRVAIGTSPST